MEADDRKDLEDTNVKDGSRISDSGSRSIQGRCCRFTLQCMACDDGQRIQVKGLCREFADSDLRFQHPSFVACRLGDLGFWL